MILAKIILCSFAALLLLFRLLAGSFWLPALFPLPGWAGGVVGFVVLGGLLLILMDVWWSDRSQDDKIWWTVLGVLFSPIVVPAYWFGVGLKQNIAKLKRPPQQYAASSESA